MKTEDGVFFITGEVIRFQEAKYIEDGWYIEMHSNVCYLWEIPKFGGLPCFVGEYQDLLTAINAAKKLT